jgi:hypothetical protein
MTKTSKNKQKQTNKNKQTNTKQQQQTQKTLSEQNVVMIGTDFTGSCKSNYHTIATSVVVQ